MPAACWRKRQTKATKCNPANVAGSLSQSFANRRMRDPMRNPPPRPTSSRQQRESSVRLLVFYDLQPHAESLRFFGGSLPGVALLEVGYFHRLPGRLLDV